jgi:GT2 family glycosyltransferase
MITKNLKNSQEPLASVNLVVHNGEKYIRRCLDSVFAQTYENIEVNVLDNNSTDSTVEKINNWKLEIGNWKLPKFSLLEKSENLGTWPGQEELLKHSRGEYIMALSADVVLDPHFIEEAVRIFEKDEKIGAIQGKIYKSELASNASYGHDRGDMKRESVIDTCGFRIYRSRRIVNIGHGEEDRGQFDKEKEILAVEGAVPVFRKQALEDCRLKSQGNKIVDPDFFWYGDDLDLAWRMRLFGWKQVFAPKVVAYHDRQTTKVSAGGNWREFIKIRKTIPLFKRRLDWRNTTLAIIKNDFAVSLLRDLPFIFWRQLRLWGYFLLFEPAMFLEIFGVAKLLPKMLKRRGEIMYKTRITPKEFRKWIY